MQLNGLINYISTFIENKVSEKYLTSLQEILLTSGIFTVASKILAFVIISMIILSFLFIIISLLFAFLLPPGFLFGIILIKSEKRSENIEKTSPDFLRQLFSMLRVGMSFENAMENLSKYGSGPLYDKDRGFKANISLHNYFLDKLNDLMLLLDS